MLMSGVTGYEFATRRGDSRELLDGVHVKYVLPKGAFMSNTVATFVQKWAQFWPKGGFLLQLFRTQM